MRSRALLILIGLCTCASAEITLETIMADPDWIGSAPESAFWSDDSQYIHYEQKREGEIIRDRYRVSLAGEIAPIAPGIPTTSNSSRAYNADRSAVVWIEQGDVFWRSLPNGNVQQLTRSAEAERDAQFVLGSNAITYQSDAGFMLHELQSGAVVQLTNFQFADDPDKAESFDTLRENQRRIYESVVEDARRRDARDAHSKSQRISGGFSAPEPFYLGKSVELVYAVLSPSADQVLLITRPKDHDRGKRGVMPNYMTESGYTETRSLRPRVGRNEPPAHTVWLFDVDDAALTKLDFSDIDGMDEDPLESLREDALSWHVEHGADEEAVSKLLKAPDERSFGIEGAAWSPDASRVALQLHSRDNKDRWLVSVDPDEPNPRLIERLTDEAWINYAHNDFGWMPDSRTLWYLSEADGYSQLYTRAIDERRAKQLTKGQFVVEEPVLGPEGEFVYFRANREQPSTWEIHRVPVSGGAIETLTDLGGVNHFNLSPSGERILVIHSEFDRHEDLFAVDVDSAPRAQRLTDTVSDAFKAIDWVIPEIVAVPSTHVDQPIYSKLYLPEDYDPAKSYPAVMFVHGAGYTQNAHAGWPYYFREFMFHTLLAQQGVIVIDMDYRASKGYGRDWRTAIYREMGLPELEDFQDGVQYLVDNYNVDPGRVGVYGGSYGGFMTFMALFRDPDLFAAGAALRPVVDWAHYNHGYTSNILNTPLVDPVAFEKSSPIFFAEGLESPLLIAAGMQDDNVFFQDSVLLVQRLLELQKEDFEIAIYPLDPHGFTHADSWLDEYRRILKLMQRYVIATE